jgi:alpha-glucosidase
MLRASREAQVEHAPKKRPFLVTRSGAAGMQRYAQTWSGDNPTSWESLKYNIKMGLSLALSGISNTGHDVGGFSGPAPDPELFVRWVEYGIFMPRFSIHSWNDDGTVSEPWMHESVTHHVRDLIKFRARLTPYLYDLMWESARLGQPVIRPTLLDFPNDPICLEENDDMMLGPSLLVAAVVEPGQTTRRVYLPRGADWFDFWTGALHKGGEVITVLAPWGQPPLFARAGSAIPANFAEQHFARPAHDLGFYLFPPATGSFRTTCYEDDGETINDPPVFCEWTLKVDATETEIKVAASRLGVFNFACKSLKITLPKSEQRPVVIVPGEVAISVGPDRA